MELIVSLIPLLLVLWLFAGVVAHVRSWRRLAQARRLERRAARIRRVAVDRALSAVARTNLERDRAYRNELQRFAKVFSRVHSAELTPFVPGGVRLPERDGRGFTGVRTMGLLALVVGIASLLLWRFEVAGEVLGAIASLAGNFGVPLALLGLALTAPRAVRAARVRSARARSAYEAARLKAAQLDVLADLARQQGVVVARLRRQVDRDTRWLRRTIRRRRRVYGRFSPQEREALLAAVENARLLKRIIDMSPTTGELEPNPALGDELRAVPRLREVA